MSVDKDARSFWSAAHFYRRAPDRDQRTAIFILKKLSETSTDEIKWRCKELLARIDHDQQSAYPS